MSLEEIKFNVQPSNDAEKLAINDWSHIGVVGSGDLEILFTKSEGQSVGVKIVTPVKGFADIWKEVLEKFVMESKASGFNIDINDNNSTPFVVSLRLRQALAEAQSKGGGSSGR